MGTLLHSIQWKDTPEGTLLCFWSKKSAPQWDMWWDTVLFVATWALYCDLSSKTAVSLCSHRFTYANQVVTLCFCQGTIGFEAQIDKCLELSEYLYNKIKDREGYEMVFNGKVSANFCHQRWTTLLPLTSASLWLWRRDWHVAWFCFVCDECHFYPELPV